MALGADGRSVLGMILREAVILVVAGALAGLPFAFVAGRSVRTLLYQVQPIDPIAYAAGAGVLIAVGVLAALVPARRASRIDPAAALTRS